jgi:hypothetical protein
MISISIISTARARGRVRERERESESERVRAYSRKVGVPSTSYLAASAAREEEASDVSAPRCVLRAVWRRKEEDRVRACDCSIDVPLPTSVAEMST